MCSAHGWASIWPSYKIDVAVDDLLNDVKMDTLRAKIADYIKQLSMERLEHVNAFAEVGYLNGSIHLWHSCDYNHAWQPDDILKLFRFVAEVALGSYGLLYVEDDEDSKYPNQFRAWVMARRAHRAQRYLSLAALPNCRGLVEVMNSSKLERNY